MSQSGASVQKLANTILLLPCVTRLKHPAMNKSVIDFYFKSIGEDRFKCKCGRIRKQTKGSGFSNLKNHINSSHPTWRTEVSSGVETIISNKEKNIFAWLEWVIMENRELHFPEKVLVRKYTKLDSICEETLLKYMDKLVVAVEKEVTETLPKNFGIICDGWSDCFTHYFAVFDCFQDLETKNAKTHLLALSPVLEEEKLTAESHVDFIRATLNFFKRDVSSLIFLVGDNENLNKCIANFLDIPLIGCASHRLNLAAKLFLTEHETLLEKVQLLMKSVLC